MADTRKNYEDYVKGKAPLKSAFVLMDDDDKIQNFMSDSIRRSMWVMPIAKWQEYQEKLKKNESDE